ncbi:MAG: hypothetical protein R3F62_01285 [Planctomycetota bacterium]
MARLTDCPDCGGKVSKRAKLCVHCGAPLDFIPTWVYLAIAAGAGYLIYRIL